MLTSVWDELDNLGIGGGRIGVSRRWRLRRELGWEILRILGSGVRGGFRRVVYQVNFIEENFCDFATCCASRDEIVPEDAD